MKLFTCLIAMKKLWNKLVSHLLLVSFLTTWKRKLKGRDRKDKGKIGQKGDRRKGRREEQERQGAIKKVLGDQCGAEVVRPD